MVLIEVKILEYTIVLVCDDGSTVSDITTLAMAEYASFNMKKFPQKVLFTRDIKGRILSGSLKIVENEINTVLEVVLVDYSASDYLSPQQTEDLYREWQVWTSTKIKEYIQELSFEEFPSYPAKHVLSLLYELCGSKKDQVQSICVKTLQIIMAKFSQKDLVIQAADELSKMFVDTSFADIAILALESFKGLSSLQMKLFNSSEYIRNMFNVQSALLRFSSDKRTELFEAFESVSSILGDEELIRVCVALKSHRVDIEQHSSNSDSSNILEREDSESNNNIDISNKLLDDKNINKSYKPINYKRLESLLSSDDPKIRLYALEKLHKLLSNSKSYPRSNDSESNIIVSTVVSTMKGSEAYELRPAPEQYEAAAATTIEKTKTKLSNKIDFDDDDLSKQLFILKDRHDLENILLCLFRCLKRCIKARSKLNPNPRSVKGDDDGVKTSKKQQLETRETNISTAGRLIEIALNSPETELIAIQLVIDCIWYIVHSPVSCLSSEQHSLNPTQKMMRFKVTGNPLTVIQLIFAVVAKEWQRLLLTLSHAAETNNYTNYHDIADKSAYFFLLVTCYGSTEGWASINIEAPAICTFLTYHRPCFRSYLALAYMAYLSRYIPQHPGDSLSDSSERDGGLDIAKLKELLVFKNFAITKCLWQWATSSDHFNRKSAVLALDCISSSCVFSEVNTFLLKLDPINRLAAILRYAVRDREMEQNEFAIQNVDSKLDNSFQYFKNEYYNVIHSEHDVDEVVDEKEFKFAIDENVDMIAVSSTSSLKSISSTTSGFLKDQKFIYPDLLLIRFILKTISNLVHTPNSIYDQSYRNELAKWILSAEVGPPTNHLETLHSSSSSEVIHHIENNKLKKNNKITIKLSRIAKADSVVMLYFNLISFSKEDHI